MKYLFQFLYVFLSVINLFSQPIYDIDPLIDIQMKKESLSLEGQTFTQSFWIECRTRDGSRRKVVQHQNSIIIKDLYFRTLVKSVSITDWIIPQKDYMIYSRYTPIEGVLEWSVVHRQFSPYLEIGGPDANVWTKLAKVNIEFEMPEDGKVFTNVNWYSFTPHYNFRTRKLQGKNTELLHGAETGNLIIDATVTRVDLKEFLAVSKNGINILNWSTDSEKDNIGFRVERSCTSKGPFKKINDSLVSGSQHYCFADNDVVVGQEYTYRLTAIDRNGVLQKLNTISQKTLAPTEYRLYQNYPNPFNPKTTIDYQLKEDGFVKVQVYNMRGQLVRNLVQQNQKADFYKIRWDGRNNQGQLLSSGVYFYRLHVNKFTSVRKLQIIR